MSRKAPLKSIDLRLKLHPAPTIHQTISLRCDVFWTQTAFETYAGRIKFRLLEPLRAGMQDCSDCCDIIHPLCLHEDFINLSAPLHPLGLDFSSNGLRDRVIMTRCEIVNCRRLYMVFASIESADSQIQSSNGPPKHFVIKVPRLIYGRKEDIGVKLKWDFSLGA